MSDEIKDGGPAFPGERLMDTPGKYYNGMSLRQYYAGKALQGLLACSETYDNVKTVSEACLDYADALIKAEREREGGK